MYICRQAEPDLIEMDLDGDGSEPKKDQWWRIHYAPFGSNPFSVEVRPLISASEGLTSNGIRKPRKKRFLKLQRPKAEIHFLSTPVRKLCLLQGTVCQIY
jgi:hypothetical protein